MPGLVGNKGEVTRKKNNDVGELGMDASSVSLHHVFLADRCAVRVGCDTGCWSFVLSSQLKS
jgi:hypothetical protein